MVKFVSKSYWLYLWNTAHHHLCANLVWHTTISQLVRWLMYVSSWLGWRMPNYGIKHYFSTRLWEYFRERLAFELVDLSKDDPPQCGWTSSEAWTEYWSSPHSVHLVLRPLDLDWDPRLPVDLLLLWFSGFQTTLPALLGLRLADCRSWDSSDFIMGWTNSF